MVVLGVDPGTVNTGWAMVASTAPIETGVFVRAGHVSIHEYARRIAQHVHLLRPTHVVYERYEPRRVVRRQQIHDIGVVCGVIAYAHRASGISTEQLRVGYRLPAIAPKLAVHRRARVVRVGATDHERDAAAIAKLAVRALERAQCGGDCSCGFVPCLFEYGGRSR